MKTSYRIALSAMLVAVMLVLGYIESLFVLGPIPGIKLGLANTVLLLALYWLGIPESLQLMVIKVTLSSYLFGTLQTLQYSLAGGVLSMLGMIVMVYAIKGVSPIGAGITGGVLHNVGQVLMAMITLETASLLYYMAVLVAAGAVMGGITGSIVISMKGFLPYERRKRFGLTTVKGIDAKHDAGQKDENAAGEKQ